MRHPAVGNVACTLCAYDTGFDACAAVAAAVGNIAWQLCQGCCVKNCFTAWLLLWAVGLQLYQSCCVNGCKTQHIPPGHVWAQPEVTCFQHTSIQQTRQALQVEVLPHSTILLVQPT